MKTKVSETESDAGTEGSLTVAEPLITVSAARINHSLRLTGLASISARDSEHARDNHARKRRCVRAERGTFGRSSAGNSACTSEECRRLHADIYRLPKTRRLWAALGSPGEDKAYLFSYPKRWCYPRQWCPRRCPRQWCCPEQSCSSTQTIVFRLFPRTIVWASPLPQTIVFAFPQTIVL